MKYISNQTIERLKNLESVTVLGTRVPIFVYDSSADDEGENLDENDYGLFLPYFNQIKINLENFEDAPVECLERVLRHEILHAFMYLSSFQQDLFPVDEEFITEWMAQMWDRINEVLEEVREKVFTN